MLAYLKTLGNFKQYSTSTILKHNHMSIKYDQYVNVNVNM